MFVFLIFAFSLVSSGNLFSCKIYCSTVSLVLFLVFWFHVSNAHSIFRYIYQEWCVSVVKFKKHRSSISVRRWKRTLTASRSTPFSLLWNIQWHDCFRFYFQWCIEIEPKFVVAIIFHPSSCKITFCELNFYTFHFYQFIQTDHPKRKI